MSEFLRQKEKVEEGDTVVIYVNYSRSIAVVVERGKQIQTKYGCLRHDDMIGKLYGTRVRCSKGYVYILSLTPEIWLQNLEHRTQILYTSDIALITFHLNLLPGSMVGEAGTGSGSLSHAIIRTIAPSGHLYTYEVNQKRYEAAKIDFERHGASSLVTIKLRDVYQEGFDVENALDAVFLDLPKPWEVLISAKSALKKNVLCRLCSFSPCIEQVQRTCDALRQEDFIDVNVIECVSRTMKVLSVDADTGKLLQKKSSSGEPPAKVAKMENEEIPGDRVLLTHVPFPAQQPTHTGYLTFACLPPRM